MGVFELVFYLAMAGIVTEAVVKLVRGHPAKWKDVKTLAGRVEELEQKLGDTMSELADARAQLDDEMSLRAELSERLDFTERMLARGRDAPPPGAA